MASKVSNSDAKKALEMHNIERRAIFPDSNTHPDLVWSDTLARHAQSWAEHMARTGRFEHSNVHSHTEGENLSWQSWGTHTAADATEGFINEKRHVSSGTTGFTLGQTGKISNGQTIGHWTQIIFPHLRKLGIGSAKSPSGAVYICARYDKAQTSGTKVKLPSGWSPRMGWTGSSGGGSSGSGQHGQNPSQHLFNQQPGGGTGGGISGRLYDLVQQQQYPGVNVNISNHHSHHQHRRRTGRQSSNSSQNPGGLQWNPSIFAPGRGMAPNLLDHSSHSNSGIRGHATNLAKRLIRAGVPESEAKAWEEAINQTRGK